MVNRFNGMSWPLGLPAPGAARALGLAVAIVAATPMVGGCAFDENLLIRNLRGRVIIPEEAVTRDIAQPDGSVETITDIKLLGPVYLGLYPSVEPANVIERFPHPEVGPQFREDVAGDAYPYGGTSVGDLRFACFEFLRCKIVSGRFLDYQEIVEWFQFIDQPILDAAGVEVAGGEFLAQTCYDLLNVNTDDEVRITAFEDRNRDDQIDAMDLDFVYDEGEKAFVGEFTIWQQELFWDQGQEECTPGEDCRGFSLWGWVDSPSRESFQYSTCDPAAGFQNQEYNANFFGGVAYPTLLNFPATYITEDDWVASEPYIWSDQFAEPDLYLDFPVQ